MRRRLPERASVLLVPVFVAAMLPRSAHAEPTAWLSVNGGIAGERNAVKGVDTVPMFTATVGVGTDPNGKFSVGGLFRSTTYIGVGTELAIGPRLATSGFTRGSFGLAFDLGVALRPFGRSDYGRVPLQGGVTVGFPWGVQLEGGLRLFDLSGQPSAVGGYVALGVDLLRLSVHRRGSTEKQWPNPAAAGAPWPSAPALPGEDDDAPGTAKPRDEESPPPPKKPADASPADDGPAPTLR